MAHLCDGFEVERRAQHGLFVPSGLGHLRACGIGDERAAVERDLVALPDFTADAVGGDEGHEVRTGVSLHDALPVRARVPRGIGRFAADRRRVEQHLGPGERHAARRLGEPLIPADPNTDDSVRGGPDAKASVARAEVVLLGVARTVGDVALAIRAKDRAIGIDDDDAVEHRVVGALEDTDGEDDTKLFGECAKALDGGIALDRFGSVEVLGELVLTEVRTLEQFRDQDDLRALAARVAYETLRRRDVGVDRIDHRHLNRGDREHDATLSGGSGGHSQPQLPRG